LARRLVARRCGAAAFLAGWLAALPIARLAAAEAPDSYAGYDSGTYLRFLAPPAPGGGIAAVPTLKLSFGGAARTAVMDTGSTGVVVSADAIPNLAALPSLGPARLTYSSSGRIMEGSWVVTAMTIAGADGAAVTTTPIPVIAVTRIACLPNARNCTPEERPTHVSMIGVGFGREYDHQPKGTPDRNPFLNLALAPGAAWRRGYVITGAGVHVGLTGRNTAGPFAFVKLARDPLWQDWSGAPACITVGDTEPACGKLLVDTGVAVMYLTVPQDRVPSGSLADGTRLKIRLGPADDPHAAGYGFTVGDAGDPVAPAGVTLSGVGVRPPFVNTSFHLLNGFDYLFDADGGWVGFRPKR
jgi:hypothetical protein